MKLDTIQYLKNTATDAVTEFRRRQAETRVSNDERRAIVSPTSEDAQRELLLFDDRAPFHPPQPIAPFTRRPAVTPDYLEAKAAAMILAFIFVVALGVLIGHGWR